MLLLLGSESHTYLYYCWLCCGRVGFVVLFAADELEKLLAKEQILRQGLEIKVGILNKQYEEATRQVVELEHSLAATTTQLQQLQLHNASRTSSALQSQGRLRQQRQGAAISEEASLRVITEAKSEAARIIAAAKDQAAITVTDALAAAEAVAARPPPDIPPRLQDLKFSSGSQDDQNAHNVATIPAAVRVRAGRSKREMWQEVEQKVEAAEQRCRADAAAQVAEQVSATQQQCARQVAEATAAKDEAVAQVASLIQRLNSEARFRIEGESTAQDLRAQLATMEVELREAKAAAAAPRPQTPERRKKGGGRFCSSRP
eukprot:COSAG01_NODE_4992_length_4562_cov_1.597132_3_plen_317_part_00